MWAMLCANHADMVSRSLGVLGRVMTTVVVEDKIGTIHLWPVPSRGYRALLIKTVGERYKRAVELIYLGAITDGM